MYYVNKCQIDAYSLNLFYKLSIYFMTVIENYNHKI